MQSKHFSESLPVGVELFLTFVMDVTVNKTVSVGEKVKMPTRVTKKNVRDILENKYGLCQEFTILADGVPIGKKAKNLKKSTKLQAVLRQLTESETLVMTTHKPARLIAQADHDEAIKDNKIIFLNSVFQELCNGNSEHLVGVHKLRLDEAYQYIRTRLLTDQHF